MNLPYLISQIDPEDLVVQEILINPLFWQILVRNFYGIDPEGLVAFRQEFYRRIWKGKGKRDY